tara:strand:- start:662 stop:1309 length:648 start_codon:yes stop_codon:yes gene_type:complete
MALTYLGSNKDVQGFHLQAGATWNVTDQGLDTFEETYLGDKARVQTFNASHQLGVRHPTYPAMYLTQRDEEVGRAFAKVKCNWVGLRESSALPQPQLQRRTSIKTATASTTTPTIATKDLTYVSPEIIWTYATDKEVLSAQHTPEGTVPGFAEEVIRSVITQEDGTRYPGQAPAPLVAALTMVAEWRMTSLNSDQIKYTPFWTNQEVWAYEYPQS